ncbi:MAG: TIGR03435 family protein [Acidobacteriota bacterium]|nr:TIGR03435 family protein [Acidobacteriota bacterium]
MNVLSDLRVSNARIEDLMRKTMAGVLLAATAMAQPTFEVASVTVNTSGDRSSFSRTGKNRLVLQNWSLQRMILKAYDLKSYGLRGPDWLRSRSFDIDAKTERAVTEAGLREMLRSLLADRFGLKAHTAARDEQAYVLLPAKDGFRQKPVGDGSEAIDDCDVSRFPQKIRVTCRHCTLDYLADVLSGETGSIVVDRSGAKGTYAFTLEWSPDLDVDGAGTSLFSALKEQLGLRLEYSRVPVSILVIDSIGRTPTAN